MPTRNGSAAAKKAWATRRKGGGASSSNDSSFNPAKRGPTFGKVNSSSGKKAFATKKAAARKAKKT